MYRLARPSDLDAICAIYEAVHDEEEAGRTTIGWVRSIYPTRATVELGLRCGDLFVLEKDGEILAAARINQVQGEEYKQAVWSFEAEDSKVMVLHTLAVHPKYFGQGLGSGFVAFYEGYAAQQGCTCLRMDTNVRNTPARTLYKKLGYTEAGVVPCRFNGIDGVQLVCLEKKLEQ